MKFRAKCITISEKNYIKYEIVKFIHKNITRNNSRATQNNYLDTIKRYLKSYCYKSEAFVNKTNIVFITINFSSSI